MSIENCPQIEEYQGLVAGKLTPDQVENLAQHLEACEPCIKTVCQLKDQDTVVALMQEVSPNTPSPEDSAWLSRVISFAVPLNDSGSSVQLDATVKAENPRALLDPPRTPGEIGRLGSYRILEQLGAGGMGVVWLADDAELGRKVAIKIMKPELAVSEQQRERFLREARAMGAVKDDHVATIYQVGQSKGIPFLVMELLEGETLHDKLKREVLIPLGDIRRIGREIAHGLAAAHARGLVHRDIKPANIWLEGSRGRVKILDFGLAHSDAEDVRLTSNGSLLGTPAYMAPEQAAGEGIDSRSDLFSLGCILYQMCTGRIPFAGKSNHAILAALFNKTPKPIRELNPGIPDSLENPIMLLLEKDPANRLSSANELAALLDTIADEVPDTVKLPEQRPAVVPKRTSPKTVPTPESASAPSNASPRRGVWFALAVGLLLLLAGGLTVHQLLVSPPRQEEDPVAEKVREQVDTVVAELRKRNPGFLGEVKCDVEDGQVVSVHLNTNGVKDLSPLAKFSKLRVLHAVGSESKPGSLEDLSSLKGLSLTELYIYLNPKLESLKPIGHMKLQKLEMHDTGISDLSPLQKMPLRLLHAANLNVKDLAPLQTMTSLETVVLTNTPVNDLAPLANLKNLTSLSVSRTQVADLTPLQALTKLNTLYCGVKAIEDLSPLRGKKLLLLDCRGTQVSDLTPLKGMPLRKLYLSQFVGDLSPLAGMPLVTLDMDGANAVTDLAPLRDMPLEWFQCRGIGADDLSPLANTRLTYLDCGNTGVSSLEPLAKLPLEILHLHATKVSDLSPLKGMELKLLTLANTPVEDLTPLTGMPLTGLTLGGTRVSELSPLVGMPLTGLDVSGTPVSDLTPLKNMHSLTTLQFYNSKVHDLTPIRNLKLTRLYCHNTKVSKLTPLKDMPLTTLLCQNTEVTDLSPLKHLPLVTLSCPLKTKEQLAIVRSIPTLRELNGSPVELLLGKEARLED